MQDVLFDSRKFVPAAPKVTTITCPSTKEEWDETQYRGQGLKDNQALLYAPDRKPTALVTIRSKGEGSGICTKLGLLPTDMPTPDTEIKDWHPLFRNDTAILNYVHLFVVNIK